MASAIGIYPLGLGPKVISEAKPVRVEPLEIPFAMAMLLFAPHAALLNYKEKLRKRFDTVGRPVHNSLTNQAKRK